MSLEDFNFIGNAIDVLGLDSYWEYFNAYLFPDLLDEENELEAKEEREYCTGDMLGVDTQCKMDERQCGLRKFWEQMPLESQREKYRELFGINQHIDWYDSSGVTVSMLKRGNKEI